MINGKKSIPVWLLFVLVLTFSVPASAGPDPRDNPDLPRQGRNCLGKPYDKLYLTQALVGASNPSSLAHVLQLSYCMPLFRFGGALFDLSNIEVGAINLLSPSMAKYGAFFSIAPISVFVLRAEVNYFHMFNFPIDGKGYYAVSGYDADFSDDVLKHELGGSASGFNARLKMTLRMKFPLGGYVSLALVDDLTIDYWWVDRKHFYKNLRWDVIMKRSDIVLGNTATLLLELAFHPNMTILIGAIDEVIHTPKNNYKSNVVAGMFVYQFKKLGKVVRNLTILARGGVYTHHANRKKQLYLFGGVILQYDLHTWWNR